MDDQLIKPQNLTISREQFVLLLPYLIMSVGSMATLLVGVMKSVRSNAAVAGLSILILCGALYAISAVWGEPSMTFFNGMMAADYYSSLFNVIFIGATGLL